MKTARIIYVVAAAYGFLVLSLGLLVEVLPDQASSSVGNHPEFYYGFFATALVWQAVFAIIAINPLKYRSLMLLAIAEKAAFFVPALILWSAGRLPLGGTFYGAMIDGGLIPLFLLAWWKCRTEV
jgi:hypothetical protein